MAQSHPVRILHLVNGEHWSGAERVQALLGSYISKSHFDVEFLCLKDGLFSDNARDLGLNVTQITMRGRHDLSVIWKIAQRVRAANTSVIHTHTIRTNLIGRLVGLLTGVPVITHVHSPSLRETDSQIKNAINTGVDRLLERFTSRYIAVSQSLGDELRSSGVAESRISVIPNGIDIQSFRPATGRCEARRELDVPKDAQVVGMVGLFRPRKGPEVLLNAFQSIREKVPEAWLIMLGPPVSESYQTELTTLCRKLRISDRVIFTGFRNDVGELLAAFDVVTMPSLYGEGTPMALLEAMAAELPVVATPVEGISDVIVDGESGLLTPAGDPDALAFKVTELLTDDGYRRRIGQAARERIVTRFSAERMARGTEELYFQVLQQSGTRWSLMRQD